MFDVNVRGALHVLSQAARHLGDGGRIVNTSSTPVGAPIAGSALYAASKAALELFGAVAAKELGPRGITVNSLRVGAVVPGMFSKAPPQRQAAMAAASPFNLETAVERARAGRDAVRWQGATRPRARARNEEQRRQRAAARSARVRSVLTQKVNQVVSANDKVHAA